MAEETKPKKPIWKKWWFWLITIFVIIIIASSGGEEKKKRTPETTPLPQQQKQQVTQEKPQIEIVFDIPFLIRKNILEVKATLGKPINEYDPGYGGTLPTVIYQKNGYELQIDYLSSTGDVAEIFLAKNSNSKNELLNAGNLDENSPLLYSVKLQPSLRPDIAKYTGVHIYRWK